VAKKDAVAKRMNQRVEDHAKSLDALTRRYEKLMGPGVLKGGLKGENAVKHAYEEQRRVFGRYSRLAQHEDALLSHTMSTVTKKIDKESGKTVLKNNPLLNRLKWLRPARQLRRIATSAIKKAVTDTFLIFIRWFFTTPVGIVTLILIILFGSLFMALNNMNTLSQFTTIISSGFSAIQRSSVWSIAGFISSQLTKKAFGENVGLFNQLASVIDFGGTRVQMRGSNTDDTPTYWCTNLVIDSFNVARDRVVLPESLGNVNTMKSYIEENFRYVDYRSSPRAALEAINRSDAVVIFYGTPGEPLLYHVGVAQANINSRGDGTIKTKEANGGWMEFTFFVIDWTIVQRDIPSGNGSAVADVAGFGII
jgi:hypothetical protein